MSLSKLEKQKSERSNLSSDIFSVLKERIIRWGYPPGHRFTEEQLCEEFQVSRSPVREALRMLVENGLVDKVPHRGYSVKQPDSREIHELYDVRLALETFLVERVAETGLPQAQWEQLRQTWQGLLNGLPNLAVNASEADEQFHETLAQAAGNQTLLDLLRNLNDRLRFVRMTDITTTERLCVTCEQHLEILDAIAARDVSAAREAMRRNIEQGRNHVEFAFKEALAKAYHERRLGQGYSPATA